MPTWGRFGQLRTLVPGDLLFTNTWDRALFAGHVAPVNSDLIDQLGLVLTPSILARPRISRPRILSILRVVYATCTKAQIQPPLCPPVSGARLPAPRPSVAGLRSRLPSLP